MHIETLAVHAGHDVDRATGAVTPPIYLSTTFGREAEGSTPGGFLYSRYTNPNRAGLERCLAQLEGGVAAAAFASGSAATMTMLQAVGPGSHVILPDDAYFGSIRLAREIFGAWGMEVSTVDMTRLEDVRGALKSNTRLIWIETPSNPLLRIVDIEALAEIARRAGAVSAVDNTWGTPILQRPLALGADVSMHSTTKYLGGHSDVLGGALVFREDGELFQKVNTIQMVGGAVPSPFECWLTMRGIRTLPLRVNAQSANAHALAEFLAAQPKVEVVHYPGLPSHAGHTIARKQMKTFGGMFSVQVGASQEESMAIARRLRLFCYATSLGGTESLIENRASVEGPATRAPQNLLRVSVGLEHIDDLRADFEAALR
ncbi:MAG TPA: aminotransferase class I/II-fold pyridoxal phosphate-dependent enzyme [Gemmatimonadaceae bacterium]|jgi:cystathionine gamma-synthase|nr:aminotransferase class I/II-fold pyridoxal phosphate-dependent enzyme [Gemmatimonadaceae bacterium]